ncbi:MAG: enoyl-CoA hydratase/isomerase family protein [Bacteroidia bacterium]
MERKLVLSEIVDRVAYLTLARPEKRNALSFALVKELRELMQQAIANPAVKVIVLRAEGKVFCAGADLEYLLKLQDYSLQENLADSMALMELYLLMYRCGKPLIAQVQGPALAGGAGLVTACDFAIATPEAHFGYPEVKRGFIPAMVSYFLLRKVSEAHARRLLLTGDTISAQEAHRLGIYMQVVTPEELSATVEAFAMRLCRENSATSMEFIKKLISDLQDLPILQGLEFAAKMNAHARATDDFRKGVSSFLHKQSIEW